MITLVENVQKLAFKGQSQASAAYARIRADILAGRLMPGDKLKILELAAALSVSPGAIREALSRLAPEQLVIARDQKGFVVAPLSVDDLEDLTDMRCAIEEIALRRSVQRGDVNWEAGVVASVHGLRRTPRFLDEPRSLVPEWVDRHAAFHAALVSACGCKRMLALHAALHEQSERYRGLSARIEESRDVESEHQALVDSALARDADALVESMLAHLRTTTAMIVKAARLSSADITSLGGNTTTLVPPAKEPN